jgi:predicted molibdopterin-dependent oxidoreductase YjgC
LNSAPSSANAMPQALSFDPLRGTATLLWAELLRHLLNNGHFNRQTVARLSGGEEFLRELDSRDGTDSIAATGVTAEKLHQVVDFFRTARSIVFIHSPDREIDRAPFDCEMIANFMLLLRAHDARAELILPRLIPNGAGMEIMGVDPMFLPGKTRPGGLPGAANSNELLQLLQDGRIRAALIIGEDPFYDEAARGVFRNTGFIAAMDWKMTETIHFANVALPGTLFLESSGTRCNFEGIPVTYSSALEAPSGMPGWKVLYKLAAALGVRLPAPDLESLAAQIDSIIHNRCGQYTTFYWNTTGEKRVWNGTGKLVAVAPRVETTAITPYLTHTGRYRKMLREIAGR